MEAVLLEVHDEWSTAERRYLADGCTTLLGRRNPMMTRQGEVDGAKSQLLAS